MSPYSFSVVRYVPNPSFTSSPFSTRQCFNASSVSLAFFFARASGVMAAMSAGLTDSMPYQRDKSWPLNRAVKPAGGSFNFSFCAAARTACVEATIRINVKMDVRKVVLLKQGE